MATAELIKFPQPNILDEVKQNFSEWETYRRQNHDPRYLVADQLFTAWQPQKVWEGTRIGRSSIGVFTTMEQVETMLAHVLGTIFPLEDNVEAIPKLGTSQMQAQLSLELLLQQFNEDESFREVMRQALKQGFLYGNGIIEPYWFYQRSEKSVAVPIWGTAANLYAAMSGGSPDRQLAVHKIPVNINRPCVKHVDIRDFYMDPHCPGPDVQKGRGYFIRQYITIEDLLKYADTPGFDIPYETDLIRMAKNVQSAAGDQARQQSEAYRSVGYQPTNQYNPGNPLLSRIELLRYYKHSKITWAINREKSIYDVDNYFGCLPCINAFYVDYPGRFYGISLADVCEGEQRLQASVINARIDELALMIHSPFVKKRGDSLPQSQMRMIPGRTIELDYPDQFKKIEWKNDTGNAHMEVAASERRVEKSTGITDMAAMGAPSAGGNSSLRTATGVNANLQATGRRIGHIVENVESTCLEPLLAMCHRFNQLFLHESQVLYFLGRNMPVDPRFVKYADVRFKAVGGRKQQSRGMLLQVMPQLMPMLLNPQILELMAQQQGLTIDMKAVVDDIADALNVPKWSWWRQMDQQQIGMYQQWNPNAKAIQMQQERLAAQSQMQEAGHDTELMKPIMHELVKQNPDMQEAMTGFKPPKQDGNAKSTNRK
jgi:hypothetical protein